MEGAGLIHRVTAILAARHPLGPDRTRKATTTPEAVARWLPAELIGAPGGDVVHAAVTTGRISKQAETPIYYGAVRHDRLIDRYHDAIAPIDKLTHSLVPDDVIVTHLGDKRTPTDAVVGTLIQGLAAELNAPDQDLAEQHEAMTRYTVGLLSFALAHRGDTGTMPSLWDVHGETRFVWIKDKVAMGQPIERLVWLCDTAMEQLRLYEDHVGRVRAAVSGPGGEAIDAVCQEGGLPLFDMTSGTVKALSIMHAARGVFKPAGLPKNTGRHWLRARLLGRCSSESLHALFGHGMVGDGIWDDLSALDPAVYRADLARVLDPALIRIGWTPRTIWESP